MKQVFTITTLAAFFALTSATAQQVSFNFGKDKTVEQLASAGWDFNNVGSIKNFIYIKNSIKQRENFTLMETPYLNLNDNDAVQLKYHIAEDAQVAVYTQDANGKLIRMVQLSPNESSVKVHVPRGGQQRIIVRVEKSLSMPANLVINSISFNNYSEVASKTPVIHNMCIKGMQDTPDQLMQDAPIANDASNLATEAFAIR